MEKLGPGDRHDKNNITQASKELGISRRTLHRKLKTYKEESAEQENLVDTSETDANSR